MAWQDRHYYPGDGPRNPITDRLGGASIVAWLLGINGVVFLLDAILSNSARGNWLSPGNLGHFSVAKAIYGLQVWRWVTYQFLHHDFFHLLFNMVGLYFFGPMMERWWGARRFLVFYLLCGLGAAALYTLLAFVPGLLNVYVGTGLVGASGCLFGVLIGCAALYPHQRVMLLFPPIPMTMRTMALLFLGIALLSMMAGSPNAGGEAAHLGGAAVGWALIKNPVWLGFADRGSASQIHQVIHQARRRTSKSQEIEVDRILDKVRTQGLASLTHREKKVLQRATDRRRNAS